MIKKFDNFINEGVRDELKPKSEEDIIKSLEKKGVTTPNGRLNHGAMYGLPTVVKHALEEGSDDVNTAFDWAYTKCPNHEINYEIIKMLVEHGARINPDVNRCVKWILDEIHSDVIELFVKNHSTLKSMLKTRADDYVYDANLIRKFL